MTATGDTRDVSSETFDSQVLGSSRPVLVDFWAPWCGPCKAMAPVLDQTAKEYADQLTVCKVDIEANPDLSGRFALRSIPALMLFQDGEVVATHVGAVSKWRLDEFLSDNLSPNVGGPAR